MPRLPIVGSDDGTWGTYLNEFLEVSLDNTNVDLGERGKLKSAAVDAAGAVMNTDTSTASMNFVVDEDNMASNSATKIPTQQSVKAYVDTETLGLATDSTVVHTTGTETIGGLKTFTSPILYDAGTDGSVKIESASSPYEGGLIALRQDAADAYPQLAIHSQYGLVFSDGTSTPDTLLSRAGVANLSLNSSRISNVANPTGDQDAATKVYVDSSVKESNLKGSVPYRSTGLSSWFTALATAPTTPLNVVIIGDSISVTTAFGVLKPWGQRIAEYFTSQGRTPLPQATWRFAYSTQVLGMSSCEGSLHSPAMGVGGVAMDLTNGQKATETAVMDGISVVYSTFSGGGSLEVRDGVGGTLLTTITTNGTTKSSNIWTSSALTRTSRTIEITSVGNTILEGVYVHDGTRDKGVRVWTASKSGYTSNDFVTTPSLALDLLDSLNPELVIIATGTNDSAANYATYMAALIPAVRTHAPNAAVALWLPYFSTAGFNATELAAARAYLDSAPFIALDVPVIDGSVGTPNISARYSSDSIHPNDTGAEYIAQHIYSVVGGDPFGQSINYSVTNKVAIDSLNTLKAPIANPIFTGLVTAPTISSVGGVFTVNNVFSYPVLSMKEPANAQPQISLSTSTVSSLLGGFNGAGISLGDGTNIPDTNIYRSAANTLKTDDNLVVVSAGTVANSVVNIDATQTLTNKRFTKRVTAITSSATPTINTDNCDAVDITALATAITSMSANITGTPANKDTLIFEIKDNGTARAITWGSAFVAGGVALPTTTVSNKILTVGFMYSTANALNKWRCVASVQEA